MRIGKLNRRITIQEYAQGEDQWGEPIEQWSEFCKVWAEIESATGNEYWSAEKYNSEVTHVVTIRYLPEFGYGMRILYNDRTGQRIFNVEYYHHTENSRSETVIQVKEVLNDE